MTIAYEINQPITPKRFVSLLRRSTLADRRPVDDEECIKGMLQNSNLTVCAWDSDLLVGIARSVTDFHYCCYLSDLAVDSDYQRQGIGIKLQQITQSQLGPRCNLILLAAPGASDYYPRLGYKNHRDCWVLERTVALTTND